MRPQVAEVLSRFPPVNLEEATPVSLDVRKERKYLLRCSLLPAFLSALIPHYKVLEVQEHRIQAYDNCYWDTPDFSCYRAHHNGAFRRFKIRLRRYVSSGTGFWEHKTKVKPFLTRKQRRPAREDSFQDYYRSGLPEPWGVMLPVLSNRYLRIHLLNRRKASRLTLDWNIVASQPSGKVSTCFPLVVVEQKQPPGSCVDSEFEDVRRRYSLLASPFSKYCLGCCRLYPQLKSNTFKPVLRSVEHLYAS